MKTIQTQRHLRPLVLSGLAMLMAATTITPGVARGQSAADIGVSHPPLVTIIFDSSSSMQWVEKGEGYYPTRKKENDDAHLDTWKTGTHLCLPGTRFERGTSGESGCLGDAELSDNFIPRGGKTGVTPIETVGPCMVWHPIGNNEPVCGSRYRRPTTCGDEEKLCQTGLDVSVDLADTWIKGRLDTIRKDGEMRLVDAETPRHIQVKQILTGDMILEYVDEDTGKLVKAGPGCWFVPRGRGTSNDQICCEEVDKFGLCKGDYSKGFDSFIDHDDPIPHYQEIYDRQERNGLLDAMARTALFSVVMFDSYRGDGRGRGWQYPMDDIIAGTSPYASWPGVKPHPIGGDAMEGGDCGEGGPCYDLGLFRFVGPTDLDLTERERVLLSDYVQEAIRDAGYLDNTGMKETTRLNVERDEHGDPEIKVYEYPLSKQPMANASPFAAVFHDLHQFFIHGQYHEDTAAKDGPGDGVVLNPFEDDTYKACRARHVVMFTDGVPEPEAGGGFGSDSLSLAYGYDESRYAYTVTEEAIKTMIQEVIKEMEKDLPEDQTIDPRFIPRVHVLAVSKEEDSEHWEAIIEKIANMAAAGRTCAQYYLPPEMVPVGSKTGQVDSDGEWIEGKCDPTDPAQEDPVCLVPQYYSGKPDEEDGRAPDAAYLYEPQDGSKKFPCEHPALLLTRNDRETMVKAFQMIFNEIASDLVTRTRPSVTNYLDDAEKAGQYRIFSGVKVGGNAYWKGLLSRQLLECNQDDLSSPITVSEMRPLHADINNLRLDLADLTGDDDAALTRLARMNKDVPDDRRRIFTSFPAYLRGSSNTLLTGASTAERFFSFTYALDGSDIADEFSSELDLAGYGSKPPSYDTRVPFTVEGLKAAFKKMDLKDDDLYRYLKMMSSDDEEEILHKTVDRYRGRLAELSDRVLGGIYNSNPVTIGPPDMDLPIASYREYRQAYFERPAMTYVGTVDGLLHAIYAGEPEVLVRNLDGTDAQVRKARFQREAWAYMPQLFHQDLVSRADGAHQILDGTPVVTDIRLCHGQANANSNKIACPANTGEGAGNIPQAAQWRTVLVQGVGTGPGYFALDITRAGDKTALPDPVVLWEFGPLWEEMQIQKFKGSKAWRVGPKSGDEYGYQSTVSDACRSDFVHTSAACMPLEDGCSAQGSGREFTQVWEHSYLGVSVAEPAIGTVPMKFNADENDTPPVQRSVAIFGGGSDIGIEARTESCTRDILGRAIYIVDLQSGEIIRRFIEYTDDTDSKPFEYPITGTPVMSAATPGESSTRAFIGDDRGRLFRLDMTSPNPEDWEVNLFFDPAKSDFPEFMPKIEEYGDKSYTRFGAASYPPAITTNRNRNLVIAYGLGQRDDSGDEQALQAMIALEEIRVPVEDGQKSGDAAPLWRMFFEKGERLTGPPVAFDNDFFFTTYVENTKHVCNAGDARIYRLNHQPMEDGAGGDQGQRWEPTGAWEKHVLEKDAAYFKFDSGDTPRWFGPREPTMIRGLTITMGPTCEDVADEGRGAATEGPTQKPQLIAQAGQADVGDKGGSGVGGGSDSAGVDSGISRIAMELSTPKTRALPMNWMVIGN